jgi:hypothetical protein
LPSPRTPAGNLKPAKDKSTERIDGIVATIMAIGRAAVQSWCLRFGNSNDAFVGRCW